MVETGDAGTDIADAFGISDAASQQSREAALSSIENCAAALVRTQGALAVYRQQKTSRINAHQSRELVECSQPPRREETPQNRQEPKVGEQKYQRFDNEAPPFATPLSWRIERCGSKLPRQFYGQVVKPVRRNVPQIDRGPRKFLG